MKASKKIKLELNKEVISSLSDDVMNGIKGGAGIFSDQDNCTKASGYSVCQTCVCDTNVDDGTFVCHSLACNDSTAHCPDAQSNAGEDARTNVLGYITCFPNLSEMYSKCYLNSDCLTLTK